MGTDFLKQKPAQDQLDLPKAQLSLLARDVSKLALTAQLEILSAKSAEEIAIAIAKLHGALTMAAAAWEEIADQTRHWAH